MIKKINIEKIKVCDAFNKGENFEHSKRVVKLCKYYAKVLGIDKNKKNLLIRAAWLHDIGKIQDINKHHNRNIVINSLNKIKYDSDDINVIVDIIENHRSEFEPSNYILECGILRICDKLDKYNKDKPEKARKKCLENLQIILDYMKNKISYIDLFIFKTISMNLIK